MRFDSAELVEVSGIAEAIERHAGARTTSVREPVLTLSLSDAKPLEALLPPPRNYAQLFMWQLYRAMQFDEHHVFRWRFEHKLVQALLLNHYCPGSVPVTMGLARALAGGRYELDALTRDASELAGTRTIVKAALGYGSGEMGQVDQRSAAHERYASLSAIDATCCLHDEEFIVQEFMPIRTEFRVHSLEGRVVDDLTFLRYVPRTATLEERRRPNQFVQGVLDGLPDGLVRHSMYAWDVALTEDHAYKIVEINVAGVHPVVKAGFHCSGYFLQPWMAPQTIATLLRFIRQRYGVRVHINLDGDRTSRQKGYWWIAACARLLDECGAAAADEAFERGGHLENDASYTADLTLSAEQNAFVWAVAQMQRVQRAPAGVGGPCA
jgi:hypothetical protein